ncbi:MAG: AAA family ATPase [Blastocatellia bacterium]
MSVASVFVTRFELTAPVSKGERQMKIEQLDVKGFRSLKDVSWRPGDLNVVIGQNGTGKSNLLRMLELISASAQGRLSKYIQAAGGMEPILWDGRAPSITFHLKMDDSFETQAIPNDYEVELARLGATGWYQVEHEKLTGDASTKYIERNAGSEKKGVLGGINATWVDSSGPPAQEALLSLVTPSLTSKPPLQYLQTVSFRKKLAGISVYHDLNVGQDSKIRQAPVARFEKRVEPDGQNLVTVLHTLYTGDREFERGIDAAMHAAFGGDYEKLVFPPAADQRVQLRVRWRTLQREQSAADLSDGTLRFLFLLTVLSAPDPPMLIAIDEPETGLHPAMMNIIAEYAVEAAMRTQLVFTTHSAQFLDAFTKYKPTTTVAKWENGETSLQVVEGDELNHWLTEYSLGSLFTSGELEAIS